MKTYLLTLSRKIKSVKDGMINVQADKEMAASDENNLFDTRIRENLKRKTNDGKNMKGMQIHCTLQNHFRL